MTTKLKILNLADEIEAFHNLVDNLYPELFENGHKIIGLREDGDNGIVCYVVDEDELELHLCCFKFDKSGAIALNDHSERYLQ